MNDATEPRLSLKVLDTKIAELQAQVEALKDAIEKMDAIDEETELEPLVDVAIDAPIMPQQLDMDALMKELRNRFGSQLRAIA